MRDRNFTFSSWERIGVILKRVVDKYALLRENIKHYEVMKVYNEVVPKDIATHSKPYRMVDDVLVVAVDEPIYSCELGLHKEEILRKLNKKLKTKIKDIHTKVVHQDAGVYI